MAAMASVVVAEELGGLYSLITKSHGQNARLATSMNARILRPGVNIPN